MTPVIEIDARMLREWLELTFTRVGLRAADAAAVARVLVEAELRGVTSHGLLLVPMYLDRISRRIIDPEYAVREISSLGSMVVLDGGSGPGQSVMFAAVERARERANEYGVGVAAVRNGNHVGMLASYGIEGASGGHCAIVMTNTGPSVGIHGALGQRMGNNAWCFAFPSDDGEPLCVDMSVAAAATGKVRCASLLGESVPPGWIVDSGGADSVDPSVIDNGGWVLPMAGHKGFALSVVIDILTAGLAGGTFSTEIENKMPPSGRGMGLCHTVILLDAQRLSHGSFSAMVARYCGRLRSVEAAEPDSPVKAPGDPELMRSRNATTISVRLAFLELANRAAQAHGVEPFAVRETVK